MNKPGTSATFSYLESVAVDGSGNVYIPVSEYSIVVRLGTDGNLTLFAGTGVSGYNGDGGRATSAQLLYPQGVAVDGSGNVYIADAYRIRKVTPAGVISTIAGNGSCCDSGDGGPATSAQLYQAERVAVDASGNVYISESNGYNGWGYKIRKVTKETGIITTIAGTGTRGYNGDNIPATSAQLNYPQGVGVDAAGNVYIADTDNWRIRKVDGVTGIITTVAGNGSYGYNGDGILATSATVAYPRDVAADAAGNLYIADSDNNRIRKVTLDGIINTIAGNGNWQFSGDGGPATAAGVSYPIGVALGAGGSFYIADSNNGRIREVNSEGIIGTIAGGGGGAGLGDGGPALGAQLDYPYGVAADLWGGVYIADYENNRIAKVSAAGIISTVAGNGSTGCGGELGDGGPATSAGLCYPQDVAVDRSGSLYIADSNNQRIRKVTPAGIISTIAGNGGWGYTGDGGPATSAQLNGPDGVAVDAAGNVYIADTQNNAIRKVDANGIISTIAGDGTGNSGYSGDGGPATNALLSYPQGVAVDAAGNVYIADTDNSAIRKVNAVGVISTIAGGSCNGNLGDGGPAASASLCYPQGVAVDTAGNLYIADSDNNIIRIVTPAGIINTIAGNGNWGFSGDGGWATNAELAGPTAVAVGPFGIYIADSQNQRVRVLPTGSTSQPVQPSCWFTVSPSSVTATVAGGSFSILVSDSGGCSWSVTGLPAWVKASATSGGGSSTVTLTVAANTGLARSANVYIGGDIIQITQAGAVTSCSYSLGGIGQGFPTTGGSGSISVTAVDGCTWTASAAPDWVTYTSPSSGTGSGSVSYTVAANAGRWRTDPVTIGGASYTISQQGAVMNQAGSLAHFASGGGWQTTFTVVNTDFGPAQAQLSFFDSEGQPMTQSSIGPNPAQPVKALADTSGTSNAGTMNPGASLQVDAPANPGGESGSTLTGSAQLSANGRVGAFGVVRLSTATGVQEAAVPLETRGATSYYLPFDNTGGYFYGVALSNTTGTQSGVGVTIRDSQSGAVVASEVITLPAYGQTAFLLADRYPALAGTSGTVQFGSQLNGQLSVLGLRFNANHAFTSVPTLVNTAPTAGLANAGALAHLAAGGGWRTIYTLANTGSTPSEAKLSFFGDDGKPLALAVSATQAASSTSQTATTFDQTLKPGTVLILETTSTADQPEQTGWAQLATTGGISGFAVFQSTSAAATQEAAVQLDAASASDLLLAFDNTNGYSNGIALANTSAQAASVTVTIHDAATGKTIGTDTLQLAADGHVSFMLADKYKETANVSGTLELSVPAGGTISAIGLRVNTNNAFTSLPDLVKQ